MALEKPFCKDTRVPAADTTTLTLLLGRLSRLNEAAVADVCAAHHTTPAETRVLALLAHRADRAASPSDIAAFVVQTSGGLTATLRRLERRGHVERVADPDDGRGRRVVLTDAGHAAYQQVLAATVERIERSLAGLELGLVDAVVRDLVAGFERAEGSASSAGFVAGVPTAPDPVPSRKAS